ncbi:MAG: hypothetical protein QY318_03605 [Candidatus Dojkabacteria bacterium]|nr:MAG: hypothetical protein QY318_03605 [Candidatus Dojkabacteria bacterium]
MTGEIRRKNLSIGLRGALMALLLVVVLLANLYYITNRDATQNSENAGSVDSVRADSNYMVSGGTLVVGSEASTDNSNTGSWKGTFGSDDNYWTVARAAASPSLDVQFAFNNVSMLGGNKIIIYFEDSNITNSIDYVHQICDWTSSTAVDNAADANCTTGGWRTLHPRRTTWTNNTDTARTYEIYDGYFSSRSSSPGTVASTPMSNFINASSNNKVLLRSYSTTNDTTSFRTDMVRIEVAVDPIYEPSDITLTAAGSATNYISDIVGSPAAADASDGTKLTIPMSATSTAIEYYLTFKNVETFNGANTLLVATELCMSNASLTLSSISLYNFADTNWTSIPSPPASTACPSDTDYAFSFNDSLIGGFDLNEHISSGEVRFRVVTNAPASVYNIQIDRSYMMVGAINSDSSKCEISWGTGTATNCVNTRYVDVGKTGAPSGSTWQAAATLEYPSSFYAQDNDDDANDNEYAASQNLSFPVTTSSNMSITAMHFATKHRSNNSNQTASPQLRTYAGQNVTTGWTDTPGSDNSNSSTYTWSDSWVTTEIQTDAPMYVDTSSNIMNLRLRTSAGNTSDPGSRDWAFAMMSIRWVEETDRITLLTKRTATGGALITGAEVSTSQTNTGSWKGTLGSDVQSDGTSNYWTTARDNASGLDKQLTFDNINLYGANKLFITIEDTNITTGNAYSHQICDWVSSTGVDNAADAQCTGGGWRTLNDRKADHTNTTDTLREYAVYDGFFSDRSSSPGTAYSTPLTNFIGGSSDTVLVRVYSTVASTVQHRLDYAAVEVGIDPIYEPAAFTKISPYTGSTSNYISDMIGAAASDGNKFTMTNDATNPLDVYFSFKNVEAYTSANTILVKPEVCLSNSALTFDIYIYNFNSTSWEALTSGAVTGTACATDTVYSYAKNNVTLSNYISSGEIRVRIATASSNTHTMSLDALYVMLGSTNTDSSLCEIAWGSGTATDCTNTRDAGSADGGSSAGSTWQVSSTTEYISSFYSLDNDDDGNNGESAISTNLSFPTEIGSGSSITAIHWAARIRSNSVSITRQLGIKDYSARLGVSGWSASQLSNSGTSFGYGDSKFTQTAGIKAFITSPYYYIDSGAELINFRLRTLNSSISTSVTDDIDFAMASYRWAEVEQDIISVDIVDSGGTTVSNPSIAFSIATASFACQTTTGTFGVANEKIRVYNSGSNPSWTLSLAAADGITSSWSSSYDFNDSAGSPAGCGDGGDADSYKGQLSIDLSNVTITPEGGCSATGITVGSDAGYVQGTTDSILLVQADGTADTGCYWDITGIEVSQKIPAEQASGNYSINMSLSVVSN